MKIIRRFYGRFQLGPFNIGQGLTIATALRRTLLSELVGLAITAVTIKNASHEYSTLTGVRESVLDITLNLKTNYICLRRRRTSK